MYSIGYINDRGQNPATGTGTYRSNLFKSIKLLEGEYPIRVEELIHKGKLDKAHRSLSGEMKKYDLVHFEPDIHWYIGSILDKSLNLNSYKKVITIHGVTALYKPELVNVRQKIRVKYVLKNVLKTVDAILAVSQSAKRLISRYLGVRDEKIFVTYNGSKFRNRRGASTTSKGEYILHVSSTPKDKRKSPELLLSSFKAFLEDDSGRDLVIVGRGWNSEYGRRLISKFDVADRVYCAGQVPKDKLASYYRHADVYLQTSIYEDFCLPVVEAMTFGVPVVSTEAYAIPEIAGDAALLVERDPSLIAERLEDVVNDESLYRNLSEKGKELSARYTWKNTAERTINTYIDILNNEE